MESYFLSFGQLFLQYLWLLLLLAYLLPAGLAYAYFYHWRHSTWVPYRIQPDRPPLARQIWHDIRWSLCSIGIFAALSAGLTLLVQHDYTRLYFRVTDYGWMYTVLSLPLALVLHDIYFYVVHRLMHQPRVFPYVHRVHHQTTNPTPWTIYAFQPLEAVLQYSIVIWLVLWLPLHPVVLGLFVAYNIVANVGGHCGFEFTPARNRHHPVWRYLNRVSHHDRHHADCRYNFSQYFNYWDRWLHTFRE